MNDLFDDPSTVEAPRKRGKKTKATAPAIKAPYDPDLDRELTRPEIETVWREQKEGYTASQIAYKNRLPIKRVEYAIGIDRHWYQRMLERIDLIAKYGQETFDYTAQEYKHRQHDLTDETELSSVPMADAARMWKLSWVPDRPSDLNAATSIDRESIRRKQAEQEKRKAFTYWLRKLNCTPDIAELVRRTAAGEPLPELGDTPGHDDDSDSIFGIIFGESDDEETIGHDVDDYLPQEIIDQCNKSIMAWLETKSLAFADAVRRNMWQYHAALDRMNARYEKRDSRRVYNLEPDADC